MYTSTQRGTSGISSGSIDALRVQLMKMNSQQLQAFATANQDDAIKLSLAAEADKYKKQHGQEALALMSGQQQKPSIVQQILQNIGQPPQQPQQPMPQQGQGQMPPQSMAPQQMAQDQMPPQGMADGGYVLPEDQGIATLPVGNMDFAEGGIVGYAGGGEVPGYKSGGTPDQEYSDAFNRAYKRLLKVEGGFVKNDAGMGPSMYGVNWTSNKDTLKKLGYTEDTVKNLTPEHAKQIYKRDYWDAIGGDKLAEKDFNFANIAFDGAANQGVPTIKPMIGASGGEPYKLLALRQKRYVDLATPKDTDTPKQAERRKEHQKHLAGWTNRTAALQTELEASRNKQGLPALTPGAQALAATGPETTQPDLDKDKAAAITGGFSRMASMIPFVGTATAAPTNPAISQIPGQSVKALPAKDAGITALTGDDNFTDPMTGFSPTQAPVGEKPRVLSKEGARQAMLGVGDLPYALAGATSDISNAALRGLTLGRYNEPEPTLGSAHLKRLATDYLGREAESADPAMRNMRTAGEIAGTFINPVAATRTAATQTEAGLNALFGAQKAKEAAAVSTPAKMPLRLTAEQPAIPVTPAGEAAASVVGSGGRSLQETQKALEAERLANQARDQLAVNQLAKQAARYAEPNPLLAETAKVASPGEKAARAIQIAGETATVSPQGLAAITPTEPETPKGGMPDLNQAFRQFELGQQNKSEDVQVAKPKAIAEAVAAAKDPVTGGTDWNKLATYFGLNLMAGKSPNALTNVGEAGIGALNMQQAEEKSKSEAEYRRAIGQHYARPSASIQELEWARDPDNMKLLKQLAQAKADPKASSAEALAFLKENGLILKELDPVLYGVLRNKVLGYAVPQVQEVAGTRS